MQMRDKILTREEMLAFRKTVRGKTFVCPNNKVTKHGRQKVDWIEEALTWDGIVLKCRDIIYVGHVMDWPTPEQWKREHP